MTLRFKEDAPGTSPPGIDGALEKTFFDAAQGDHVRRMRELELGVFGKWLGGEHNAPLSIAFICIAAGIVFGAGCLVVGGLEPSASTMWGNYFEKDLEFIGVVIAYVFGRGSRPTA